MKLYTLTTLSLLLSATQLHATPNFAREYGVSCSTCHTMVPTLNETGESFLRNGFRFSSEDTPTLQKIINPKKEESRPIPLAVMLNANYDTNQEELNTKVKLYGGGTLTQNLSFFGMSKETFNDENDNQSIFTQTSSRLYAQLNFEGSKHLIRAGLISPLTQFGNIQKASSDAGLKGHNQSDNNGEDQGKNSLEQKYGNSANQGNTGTSHQGEQGGNSHYQTPLQNASVGNIKGAEYSYLANEKLMLLLSYGLSVDKSNRSSDHGHNQSSTTISDEDDYQMMGGIRYKTDNGYRIGLIYNQYEKEGQENFSAIVPLEKRFDNLHLVSTLIYRDENSQEKEYYGWENSLIYTLSESDYLRGVVDVGQENSDEDSYGLSLGYSKAYKSALFHLTGARRDTQEESENLFLGSVSLLF